MAGVRATVFVAVLLLCPNEGRATTLASPSLAFLVIPPATSAVVTGIFGSLIAYGIDGSERFPLLKSYGAATTMGLVGGLIGGFAGAVIFGEPTGYLAMSISLPVVFGTVTIISLLPSDEPEEPRRHGSLSDGSKSVFRLAGVGAAPLNDGFAATVAWSF
jgi:hypothetical protein